MSQPPAVLTKRIAVLWARMVAIYGHRWTSAYGDDIDLAQPTPRTWAEGIAALSDDDLRRGIASCASGSITSDGWPPTLPQFVSACRGIPSLAKVRMELMPGHTDPSPFTRLVWRFIDVWRFRTTSEDRQLQVIRDAYELARDAVMRGEPLPEKSSASIEQQRREFKPASPETVAKEAAKVEQLFGRRREPSSEPPALSATELAAVEEELRRQAFERKQKGVA